MDRDASLQAFVGKKLEKFEKKKFSILAFLFGSAYVAYRKLLVPALMFAIIDCLLLIATPNIIPYLAGGIIAFVLRIVLGILFPKLYRNFYHRKVDIILSKTNINYVETAQAKGGTNILFFVLIIMLVIIVPANVRRLLGFDEGSKTINLNEEIQTEEPKAEEEEEEEPQEVVQLELTEVEGEQIYNYNGETLTYSKSKKLKLNDHFNVVTPFYLKNKSTNSYEYDYEYKIKEEDKYLLSLKLNEVLGEYDAEKLAKGINYFVNKSAVVSTITVNDITWYLCQSTTETAEVYEYYTNLDDKTFRLEISEAKDVDKDFSENASKLVNQLTGGVYKADAEDIQETEWVLFETEEELERFKEAEPETPVEEPVEEEPQTEEPETPTQPEEGNNRPEITNSDKVPDYIKISEVSLEKKRSPAREDVDETYAFTLADDSEFDINITVKDYMDMGAYEESIKKATKVKYTKSDMSLNDIDWKVLVFEEMVDNKYNLVYAADVGDKVVVIDAKYVTEGLDEESSTIINNKFSEIFNAITKAEE